VADRHPVIDGDLAEAANLLLVEPAASGNGLETFSV
jgi:hypothetical protein